MTTPQSIFDFETLYPSEVVADVETLSPDASNDDEYLFGLVLAQLHRRRLEVKKRTAEMNARQYKDAKERIDKFIADHPELNVIAGDTDTLYVQLREHK